MRKRNFVLFLILTVGIFSFILNCGTPVTVKKLTKTNFQLGLPAGAPGDLLKHVVDFEIDPYGNLYVVDGAGSMVLKYTKSGKYLEDFSNRGAGNYERMVGVETIDSSVVLHTHEMISFHLPDGRHSNTVTINGRGDLSTSNAGYLLINRSMDGAVNSHIMEVFDSQMKVVSAFHTPRAEFEEDGYLDFGFADFTPDTNIVYLQVYSDSAFVYDLDGNLKHARKLKTTSEPYVHAESGQPVYFDDMAVSDDGIYVVRLDLEKTTDEFVYVNKVEKYDFELNLVETYELPESFTMTTRLMPWAPWYHKFQVYDHKLYFFVAQPQEHLEVYVVE